MRTPRRAIRNNTGLISRGWKEGWSSCGGCGGFGCCSYSMRTHTHTYHAHHPWKRLSPACMGTSTTLRTLRRRKWIRHKCLSSLGFCGAGGCGGLRSTLRNPSATLRRYAAIRAKRSSLRRVFSWGTSAAQHGRGSGQLEANRPPSWPLLESPRGRRPPGSRTRLRPGQGPHRGSPRRHHHGNWNWVWPMSPRFSACSSVSLPSSVVPVPPTASTTTELSSIVSKPNSRS